MKKFIVIEGDTNDGDYISRKSPITDEEIELIKPVIQAIKDFKPYVGTKPEQNILFRSFTIWKREFEHNFPHGSGRYIPKESIGEKSPYDLYGHIDGYQIFEEFCPFGQDGIHSIISVDIVLEGEKLF